jgi:NADH-quinone oxidoreductase subunit J
MLLDLKAETRRKLNLPAVVGGSVITAGFLAQLFSVLKVFNLGSQPFPPIDATKINDVASVGKTLFTAYNLPFQIVGTLVLVATVGVVVLSRRELK